MKNKKLIYTISLITVLLDQIIKYIVMSNMTLHQEIKLIPNFFSLYYLKNTGAAFSILGNKTIILILVSIFCLIIIKNAIKKLKRVNTLTIISLGIMTGGIIGNLFDRILYKSVIDYLSFNIFNYNFPVFNLADIGITVGAILLIIDLIIEEKEKKKPNI
ncbi:MAG: signal peptidase II [Bacilli bacterium]|nr:signal peptidase II [Bacilli bacterium]